MSKPSGNAGGWRASGYVEGVGWLKAGGRGMIDAMEALQALAAQRVADQAPPDANCDEGDGQGSGGAV